MHKSLFAVSIRNSDKLARIMRTVHTRTILFLLLSFCGSIEGFSQYPAKPYAEKNPRDSSRISPPVGYVNDFENIYSFKQIQSLDSICSAIEKESTIEIAVVTIDSALIYTLDSVEGKRMSIDSITLVLAQSWGIGKKGKDNGILIGFSKRYRTIRIQNGNGIIKTLSNSDTKRIIENITTPEFKKGNYYDGLRKGILALYAKLNPTGTIH